jgi:hypothetical protein
MEIKSEKDIVKEIEGENTKQVVKEEKQTVSSILLFFTKQFSKFYGIRMLFSLLKLINKMRLSKSFTLNLNNLFDQFFNLSNFRTALFASIMPSLYKLLSLLFDNIKNADNEKVLTFLAGFLSGLIGVFIEERTQLFTFIILSIMVRCIHTIINITLEKNNINFSGKKASFISFLLTGIGFMIVSFLHPSFRPVTSIVDNYSCYANKNEKREMDTWRNAMRLI